MVDPAPDDPGLALAGHLEHATAEALADQHVTVGQRLLLAPGLAVEAVAVAAGIAPHDCLGHRVELQDPAATAGGVAAQIVEHQDVPVGQEVRVVLAAERAGHRPAGHLGLGVDRDQRADIAQGDQQVAHLQHREGRRELRRDQFDVVEMRRIEGLAARRQQPGQRAHGEQDRDLVENLAVGRDLQDGVLIEPGLEARQLGHALGPGSSGTAPRSCRPRPRSPRDACCARASTPPANPCRASPARRRTGTVGPRSSAAGCRPGRDACRARRG